MHVVSRLWMHWHEFKTFTACFKFQADYLSITQMAKSILMPLSTLILPCDRTMLFDPVIQQLHGRRTDPKWIYLIPISLVPKFSLICGTGRKEGRKYGMRKLLGSFTPHPHHWWKVTILTKQIYITRSAIYNCELTACDLWGVLNSRGIYHKYARHSLNTWGEKKYILRS